MNIDAITQEVLNDPGRTKAVVQAAANLLNQLEDPANTQTTIKTDKSLMAAGSDLKGAFGGWDSGKYGGSNR